MSAAAPKHICLLGFSSEVENILKKLIETRTNQIIGWVSAQDRQLNGVVINALFLDRPQIRQYLERISCPAVCAYTNANNVSQEEIGQMPALDVSQPKNIDHWLEFLLGKAAKKEVLPEVQKALDDKILFDTPSAEKTRDLETILRYLSADKTLTDTLLVAHQDTRTWIKPSENTVFITYHRGHIPAIDQFSIEREDLQEIPVSARPLKLDLWAFETIWQSEIDCDKYIQAGQYYHFHRWPQPLGRSGRTEALRLTACAQTHPVTLEMLQEKTNYSSQKIKRFLFASKVANHATIIDKAKAEAQINSTTETVAKVDQAEVTQQRSFFRRLRDKLKL